MWKRGLRSLWILFVCTLWCQSLLTSILALGWIYRWVHQVGVRRIFYLSPLSQTRSWRDFLQSSPELISLQDPPALFRAQKGSPQPDHQPQRWIHALLHSLWLNGRRGLAGILTTWSLTLLPALIGSWAWYTGWQISFTKLYEESNTGRSLGALGVLIFSIVMLYVPLAQSRQGVTQDWRSFFDLSMIRALIGCRPLRVVLLAIAYIFSSLLLIYFKTMPAFLPAINPDLDGLTPSEALDRLRDYYFYTGTIGFLIVVLLRSWGARIYAGGLVSLWTRSRLDRQAFHPQERSLLALTQIPYGSRPQPSGLTQRILKLPLAIGYRGVMLGIAILAWGIVGFLPFVAQFLHYTPGVGFLNQPLIQLPCFQYIPPDLERAAARLEGSQTE